MSAHPAALPVTGATESDRAAILDFTQRLLRLDAGMENIIGAATESAAPMVQLLAASLFLYGQTNAANSQADIYLARVEPRAGSLNEREKLWLQGLQAWRTGAFHRALDTFEANLVTSPADLLADRVGDKAPDMFGKDFLRRGVVQFFQAK